MALVRCCRLRDCEPGGSRVFTALWHSPLAECFVLLRFYFCQFSIVASVRERSLLYNNDIKESSQPHFLFANRRFEWSESQERTNLISIPVAYLSGVQRLNGNRAVLAICLESAQVMYAANRGCCRFSDQPVALLEA